MKKCKTCIHEAACQSWIDHGKTLYADFEYSVEECPHFSPFVIPQRRLLSAYCPICDHHLAVRWEDE